jgi:ABC-type polar amino acid transport system ATPase subunit
VEGAHIVNTILELRDVHLRRGLQEILRGASFTVGQGELAVIMGASGSGKTTILRAIAGLEPFQAGRIAVDDVSLASGDLSATSGGRAALRQLRRKVGLVFQFHCLFEHMSALDNVCLAPVHAHGVGRDEARRRAHWLLQALGVEHRAAALPRELSGGEAQRVAIARALAVEPKVLLMDEPTAALDQQRREELGVLLRGLVEQGRTLLVVTHDEDFAAKFATRVLQLADRCVRVTTS